MDEKNVKKEEELAGNNITKPDKLSDEELENVAGGTRSYGSVSPIPTPIA